jgi:DNA-binding LytR/AlgR family response regulator
MAKPRKATTPVPHARPRPEKAGRRSDDRGDMKAAAPAPPPADYLRRIPVQQRHDVVLVPCAQVAAIVADGSRLTITTVANQQYVIEHPLVDLETRLNPSQFIRLNRGALVNVDAITRIVFRPGGTGRVVLHSGQEIGASRIQLRRLRPSFRLR